MNAKREQARQAGFSLIEAMVGLTVGMIAVLIISQTFVTFETQKQTTTAGADAQENGLIALTQIEQDVRNAGGGFGETGAAECGAIFTYHDTYAGAIPDFSMTPVSITDGGAGSDSITIRIPTDVLASVPSYVTNPMPPTSAELNVNRTDGFADGQLVLMSQGGNCALVQITQVQPAALKIQHNSGGGAPYNPGVPYAKANGWPAFTSGAKVQRLGNMLVLTYSIDASRNLQVSQRTNYAQTAVATVTPLVREIVALQAQYGIADAGSEVVNNWVDATAASGWNVLDSTKVKRIKAVRITVAARAGKRENSAVTTVEPAVGVSALPDWQNYRYKTYTTIVPLRNVLWANL